jgi:hypothetical protein
MYLCSTLSLWFSLLCNAVLKSSALLGRWRVAGLRRLFMSPVNKQLEGEVVCFAESGLRRIGTLPGGDVLLSSNMAIGAAVMNGHGVLLK